LSTKQSESHLLTEVDAVAVELVSDLVLLLLAAAVTISSLEDAEERLLLATVEEVEVELAAVVLFPLVLPLFFLPNSALALDTEEGEEGGSKGGFAVKALAESEKNIIQP
jgi:hypothetical protein